MCGKTKKRLIEFIKNKDFQISILRGNAALMKDKESEACVYGRFLCPDRFVLLFSL